MVRNSEVQGKRVEDAQDLELLRQMLEFSIPREKSERAAQALLSAFGSLEGIFCARMSELIRVEGISEITAVLVRLIPDIYRRSKIEKDTVGMVIEGYRAAGHIMCKYFWGVGTESVMLLCIDAKRRFLACHKVSDGGIHGAVFNLADIMRCALYHDTAGIYLAHNHPGGVLRPSMDDIAATKSVSRALEAVGIRLLDHFIVSNTEFCSISEFIRDHSNRTAIKEEGK